MCRSISTPMIQLSKQPLLIRTLNAKIQAVLVKISRAANETYEAREGAHDDLVLSLASALFVGENQGTPAYQVPVKEMYQIWREAGHDAPHQHGIEPRRIWGSRPP